MSLMRIDDDCLAHITKYLTWQLTWRLCQTTRALHRKLRCSLGEMTWRNAVHDPPFPSNLLATFTALKRLEIGCALDQPTTSYAGIQYWLLPRSLVHIKVHSLAALKWLLSTDVSSRQVPSIAIPPFEDHLKNLSRLEIRATPGDTPRLSDWPDFQKLFALSCLATTHLERISSSEHLHGLLKTACDAPNLEDLQFSHELPLPEEFWLEYIPRSLTRLSASVGANPLSETSVSALPQNLLHLSVTTSRKMSNPNILGFLPPYLETLDLTLPSKSKPLDVSLLPRTLRSITIRPQFKVSKSEWKSLPRSLVSSSLVVSDISSFTYETIQELKEIEAYLPDLPPQYETTLTVSCLAAHHIQLMPCAPSIRKLCLECFGEEAMNELSRFRSEKSTSEDSELGGEILLTNLDQLICPESLASLNLENVEKSYFDPLRLFEAIGQTMTSLEYLSVRGDSPSVPYNLLLSKLVVCRLRTLKVTYETNKSGINVIDFSAPWALQLEHLLLIRSRTGQDDDRISADELWVRRLPSSLRSLQAKSVVLPFSSTLSLLPSELSRLDIAVKEFHPSDFAYIPLAIRELRLYIRSASCQVSPPVVTVKQLDRLLPRDIRSSVITGARWKVLRTVQEREDGSIVEEDERTRLSGASLELRARRPSLLLCTGIVI